MQARNLPERFFLSSASSAGIEKPIKSGELY